MLDKPYFGPATLKNERAIRLPISAYPDVTLVIGTSQLKSSALEWAKALITDNPVTLRELKSVFPDITEEKVSTEYKFDEEMTVAIALSGSELQFAVVGEACGATSQDVEEQRQRLTGIAYQFVSDLRLA